MDTRSIQRRADELARADLGLDELYVEFDELARRIVRYEAAAWSTLDPTTGLMTSCTVTGIPKDLDREAAVFAHEFDDDEPNSLLSMIAERRTVAVLSETTRGDLRRAGRYRAVGEPLGVTDELRALAWAGGVAWSMVAMYRVGGTISRDEADRIGHLCGTVGVAVRLALLRAVVSGPHGVDDPPGVLTVDADGHVDALTEPAARWLEVGGPKLVTAAIATAAALRARPTWDGARTLVTIDGAMLTLTGASVVAGDGRAAVIVDRARRPQVAPMLVDAYGLTDRQRDVLGRLLLGRSLGRIASELGISEHTVNDHRKAIYRAFGVASRSELAALLQHEHYLPLRDRDLHPSPYGGFLAATGPAARPAPDRAVRTQV